MRPIERGLGNRGDTRRKGRDVLKPEQGTAERRPLSLPGLWSQAVAEEVSMGPDVTRVPASGLSRVSSGRACAQARSRLPATPSCWGPLAACSWCPL